jgi:phosphate-selective porin OprO/OprP
VGTDGFILESEDGDFRLQIRGYLQSDGRFYLESNAPTDGANTFLLRRVRPIIQGTISRYFDFNLTPDFGGGEAVIQDAYLDARASAKLRVRVGRFKPPGGLERLQSDAYTAFVERALPSSLLPSRDIGVQLHGELASETVAYAAGVFNGSPDSGNADDDSNDGKDVAARIFVSPGARGGSPLTGLGFGIAGTTGTHSGALPVYVSGGQLPIFTYVPGVVADGTHTRLTPQLSFFRGPLGFQAEYARSRSEVRQPEAGTSARITLQAWQATALVSLTGDTAQYDGVRPRRPYDPGKGQWGALELAVRVNAFEADDLAFSGGFADREASVRKALAWGLGLNWHLTRHVKQQITYERTSFTGGAAGGADRPAENALFIRTQMYF